MLKVIPIAKGLTAPYSINVYQEFQYNVENFASNYMIFPYNIGEGPLYWYRIYWHNTACPDQPFVDSSPEIIYEDGNINCPIEIIDTCEVLPPSCPCEPCVPGECVRRDIELWHMLATSVTHLCYRINNECCHKKPKKWMRRVQKFLRPALCCDVEKFEENGLPIIDEWVDVDFVDVCECGNLVDPCIATVVYPWHINNCGINGPAYPPVPLPPPGGLPPATLAAPIVVPEKQMVVNKVPNKFGPSLPEVLHCKHNLNYSNLLKGLRSSELDLYYDKQQSIWRGIQYFRDIKLIFEWALTDSLGYKFNLYISQGNIKTSIILNVKDDSFINKEFSFSLEAKKGEIKKGFLRSKVIQDDLGLFRTWDNLNIFLKG